jgi:hypothetical protein
MVSAALPEPADMTSDVSDFAVIDRSNQFLLTVNKQQGFVE